MSFEIEYSAWSVDRIEADRQYTEAAAAWSMLPTNVTAANEAAWDGLQAMRERLETHPAWSALKTDPHERIRQLQAQIDEHSLSFSHKIAWAASTNKTSLNDGAQLKARLRRSQADLHELIALLDDVDAAPRWIALHAMCEQWQAAVTDFTLQLHTWEVQAREQRQAQEAAAAAAMRAAAVAMRIEYGLPATLSAVTLSRRQRQQTDKRIIELGESIIAACAERKTYSTNEYTKQLAQVEHSVGKQCLFQAVNPKTVADAKKALAKAEKNVKFWEREGKPIPLLRRQQLQQATANFAQITFAQELLTSDEGDAYRQWTLSELLQQEATAHAVLADLRLHDEVTRTDRQWEQATAPVDDRAPVVDTAAARRWQLT